MIDLKNLDCHFERMSAYEVLQYLIRVGGIEAVTRALGEILEVEYIQKVQHITAEGLIVFVDGKEYAVEHKLK